MGSLTTSKHSWLPTCCSSALITPGASRGTNAKALTSRLYGGLSGAIAVFPLSNAGNNQHVSLILSSANMPDGGQRGVVSALATGRAFPALEEQLGEPVEVLAVGTFSGYVGVYITEPQWLQANLSQASLSASGVSKYGSQGLIEGQNLCIAAWRMPVPHGIHQVSCLCAGKT